MFTRCALAHCGLPEWIVVTDVSLSLDTDVQGKKPSIPCPSLTATSLRAALALVSAHGPMVDGGVFGNGQSSLPGIVDWITAMSLQPRRPGELIS